MAGLLWGFSFLSMGMGGTVESKKMEVECAAWLGLGLD
jgi:hypothetical protein